MARADLLSLTEPQWQLLSSGTVANKPLAKLFWIERIFAEETPDIALLNEVGGLTSLQHFVRLFLGDRYEIFYEAGNSERGIESAFLVRKALPVRCEIRSHRDWPVRFTYQHELRPDDGRVAAEVAAVLGIPSPEQRLLSRDIPELRIYDARAQSDAKPLLVLLLCHLKSGFDPFGLDPRGTARRAGEAVALAEILKSAQLETAAPVVLAGDFNCNAAKDATAAAMRWLYETTDYQDALEVAGRAPYERITHITYFGRAGDASQYDYIFLPKSLHHCVVTPFTYVHRYRYHDGDEAQLPGSMRERYGLPSDHYPVVCTVDVPHGG